MLLGFFKNVAMRMLALSKVNIFFEDPTWVGGIFGGREHQRFMTKELGMSAPKMSFEETA